MITGYDICTIPICEEAGGGNRVIMTSEIGELFIVQMSDAELEEGHDNKLTAEVSATPEQIAQLAMKVLSGDPRSKTMPGATLIMAAYVVAKNVVEKERGKNG